MGVFDKFSGIGVASGFKLQAKAPLDVRQVVDTIDDRNALITENGAYEGMQVYVKADKKTYVLKDLAATTWEELGAGGSGSSVQADYNQNDSTAADYIKNRPFYEETKKDELTEVFNETLTFEKNDDSEKYSGGKEMEGKFPLDGINPGDTISVTFNGTEYSCVVEKFEEDEITGIQFGNISLIPDSSGKDTGEPFASVYYQVEAAGSVLFFITTIQSTSIPVIIKATKTTTVIHTIDPKFIKDMYYETTSEAEVYSGTLTDEESSGSTDRYKATLSFPTNWAKNGDTAIVTIADTNYSIPVITGDNKIYAGDTLDDALGSYGIRIRTDNTKSENNTTIETLVKYTDASLNIKVIHSNIRKVPQKYISIADKEIAITPKSLKNDDVTTALTQYFVDNPTDYDYLKTINSWQLKITTSSAIVSFVFERTERDILYESFIPGVIVFSCLYVNENPDDFFDSDFNSRFAGVSILKRTDGFITRFVGANILSDSGNWLFMVGDKESSVASFGNLGILHFNDDTGDYKIFNGSVTLHDWITKAQQRSDFQIPAPTKETDLVDKKYADSLVSGGSSLTIELAVGASETTDTVFKTYLNNNASVLTQLEAASSFTLKVVKTTSVTTLTTTYTFAKNYTNTFTGAQYHFVCVYGTGETTVEGTVLWFSVSDSAVSDLKLTTYDFARITYNHCISITDGSTYSLKFIFPSKSATLVTTQAQLTTLIGNSELPASGWALVDSVYYTIGFIKNNSYCYYGNAKEPTWHSLGEYTITDTLL